MCPFCWGLALSSFCGLFATSLIALAGKDPLTLATLVPVVAAAGWQRWSGTLSLPAWVFPALLTLAVARVAYLLIFHGRSLLAVDLWHASCRIAAGRCPTKTR